MRNDRDWMSGAILHYSRSVRNSPEAQDDIAFGICRDLGEYGVQLYDMSQGNTFAAIFNVCSPTTRSANKLSNLIINAALSDYEGDVRLKGLSVVPKNPEHNMMMLDTAEHTWPQIGQSIPEYDEAPAPDEVSGQLAEIIPISSRVRPRLTVLRRATDIIPIYPSIYKNRD